jgi:hypothetical protein
LIKQFPFFIE